MEYMKQPCKDCPFRRDKKPFLHPERAEEIAYAASNPYNSFSCHKTTEFDEDGNGYSGSKSMECAGFLTMRSQFGEDIPEGFEPAYDLCYEDENEMINAYTEEWDR